MDIHPQISTNTTFINNNLTLLKKNLSSERPHQSWIIYGNQGIGKSTLISEFINKSFFSKNNARLNSLPSMNENYNPDLLIINNAANKKDISVEDIRKINAFLHLTPLEAEYRVVLIDNCNYLNKNASNALLKILEEPPKNALIFLISHALGNLPATILSRCLKLRFCNLPSQEALAILLSLLPNLDTEYAKQLLILSHESPGLALELNNYNVLDNYQNFLQLVNNRHNLTLKSLWQWLEADDKSWQLISIIIDRFLSTLIKVAAKINNVRYICDLEQETVNNLTHNSMDALIELYDYTQNLLQECSISNLDSKQVFLTIFDKFRNIL